MGASRSRWSPLVGFALASSANQMAWLVFAPVTTGAAAHFGVSTSTVGLLSEVFPLVYVLLAVPTSRAIDRSFHRWLGAGAVLSAAGTLVRLGGVDRGGFAWVLGGQVLVAAAQPLLLNSVTALPRRYLRPEHRPIGISIGSAGTFIGFVLAFVAGGAAGGHRAGVLLVAGALYAVAGAAVLLVALARVPSPLLGPASGDDPVPPGDGSGSTGLGDLRRLWADPVMRGLSYLVFVGFGVFVSLTTWVQPLLQPAGVTTASADTLLTLMVVLGVASSAVVPPVVARRGFQLRALVGAGVAAIAGCLLLAALPGVPGAAAALGLVGLCLLPCMPVMLEVAERRVGGAAAGAGLLWLAGNAGGIVVTVVCGAFQHTPWLAFGVLAAVLVVAAPAAARLRGRLSALAVAP